MRAAEGGQVETACREPSTGFSSFSESHRKGSFSRPLPNLSGSAQVAWASQVLENKENLESQSEAEWSFPGHRQNRLPQFQEGSVTRKQVAMCRPRVESPVLVTVTVGPPDGAGKQMSSSNG